MLEVTTTPGRNRRTADAVIAMFALSLCAAMAHAEDSVFSLEPSGRLKYLADEQGNRLPDFSRAGYGGGGVAIPDVPVVETLEPQAEGDDTSRIQAAIDRVARRQPDRNGFRGAVLLKRGTYRVQWRLHIEASGVVLRGEGQFEDGTIILATGTGKRTLIETRRPGRATKNLLMNTGGEVVDPYAPWGGTTLTLSATKDLSVGDKVMLTQPWNARFIRDIGMDRIAARANTKQWGPTSVGLEAERTITAINGRQITIDAPVMTAIEQQYGGASVHKFDRTIDFQQIGIEHLRLVSAFDENNPHDEQHAWTGIGLRNVTNAWVRNVTTVHFSHGVSIGRGSRFVTVQDSACLDPVSQITGGRRYAFDMQRCQYALVQRCYTRHSRHAQATGSRTYGPNVFLDCLNENTHSDTGPHHRWAAGTLWDNLRGGPMNVQDRGNWGTGHGWAGAVQVFWNCRASSMAIQQPPTSQNYAIGCTGKLVQGRLKGRQQGHIESHGTPVKPRSLYLQQLKDRLGPEAVANVTNEPQRNGTIHDWLKRTLSR
jgi:hypothetical protein